MLGMVTHGLFYIFLFSFWLVFTSVPGWRIHNCSKKPTKKKWCAAYLGCELDTFKPFQIVFGGTFNPDLFAEAHQGEAMRRVPRLRARNPKRGISPQL
jgi:hypothetical protein